MSDEKLTPEERIAAAEARIAARRAAAEGPRLEQAAIDAEAKADAVDEHGEADLAVVEIPFTSGLPMLAIFRTPTTAETKRYRDRVKPKAEGKVPDFAAAAEEIALVTRVYPDAETLKRMCAARPALLVECGTLALGLARGRDAAEGKG